jgi:putative hydrolase of the HAD superfamily
VLKAIVFDCFGVLTSDGWLPFAEKHFGHDAALKQQAHDLNKQVDSGFLSYDEFVEQIAELAHVPVTEAYADIENNVANERLFAYIQTLKEHYKIGMLSNAGANWLHELFSPEQGALFDAVVLSFEIGTVKPDPRAYHAICDKLGVGPEEAVFIDDIERYATGAKDIGMHAICYKNVDQVIADLEALQSALTNQS